MSSKQWVSLLLVMCLWTSLAYCGPRAVSTPRQLSEIAGWKGAAPKDDNSFTFVVISDRTGRHLEGAWATAIEKVNLLQPDFVITVGDLIEGYTDEKNTILKQWEDFEELTNKFQAPFFYCPGNHDVTNDVMLEIYRKRHGVNAKSYYSFDYRNCHFVVLDSQTATRLEPFADEQFEWLAKDIAAATSAEHVLVFYHHPLWNRSKLWNRMRSILPADKTTIFSGHEHKLSFKEADGIPSYTLSASAATSGIENTIRIMGEFLMVAQVTVNNGKLNVALLPIDDILSVEFAKDVTKVRSLSPDNIHGRALPSGGGYYTLQQKNLLDVPVTVTAAWQAPGWTVTPPTGRFVIPARGTLDEKFLLTPQIAAPMKPKLSVTYEFTDPYSNQPVKLDSTVQVGTYAELKISRAASPAVDGELNEYSDVAPLVVGHASRIYAGLKHWTGPADSSFQLRAATDGERLFVAVDVTDDQIYMEEGSQSWLNDAVEFYWDARPPAKRDGAHGKGTGHLMLLVPPVGAKSKPIWAEPTYVKPKGLVAVCKRSANGYVYEFSIPLSELGAETPPKPGQEFRMELRLDDGDIIDGKSTSTRMTSSGVGLNYSYTSSYIRCTFE